MGDCKGERGLIVAGGSGICRAEGEEAYARMVRVSQKIDEDVREKIVDAIV